MKVMVTGATGMVGRNLVDRLSCKEGITLLTPDRGDVDLLDQQAVLSYMKSEAPDFVYHLAAKVGGIGANLNEPVEFLSENILTGMHVILAARDAGVSQLINLGSSCMYPKDRARLQEEDILTGALEPTNEGYALAKISAALLCRYIHKKEGLQYKTLIPCNLYGKYDHFDPERSHMVPAVIRKLHLAKQDGELEVAIWGDGKSRREFMYVDDLVDFLLLAFERIEELPELLNVGLGYDYSIDEYYQVGAEIVDFDGNFSHDLDKPAGMRRKLMDVSKAHAFGWEAKTSLQDGMSKTYQFYLETEER